MRDIAFLCRTNEKGRANSNFSSFLFYTLLVIFKISSIAIELFWGASLFGLLLSRKGCVVLATQEG